MMKRRKNISAYKDIIAVHVMWRSRLAIPVYTRGILMKTMLVVAHGSRRAESNDEVRELARLLGSQVGASFGSVSCAFLELAEPSIPDGLRAAIAAGARDVVVMPYFLSAGRHVVTDIPGEVDIVRTEYPDINITLAPYLGAAPELASLILRHVQSG
jgi:sirohydrochlorin ferrochelatase